MRQFWGQQQRFFKEMANAAKVSLVVEQAKEALDRGMNVVIGLQSTGESGMDKVSALPTGGSHSLLRRTVASSSRSFGFHIAPSM